MRITLTVEAFCLDDEVMVVAIFEEQTLVPFTYLEVSEGDDINGLSVGRAVMRSIAHSRQVAADLLVS